jgi:hypothetical protein
MSQMENDRADPAAAVDAPVTMPDPVRPRNVIWTLFPILGVWVALLIAGYLISFESLTWAIILLLLIGFVVSTIMFRRRRDQISKHVVKALDYVTILTFVTGIVAVSDIDKQSMSERAERASAQIKTLEENAQNLLKPQLDAQCRGFKFAFAEDPRAALKEALHDPSKLKGYLSLSYMRQLTFCSIFSYAGGRELRSIPLEQVQKSCALAFWPFGFGLLPDGYGFRDTLTALQEYSFARSSIEQGSTLIGAYISRAVAFLLVAFAFSVRLTRTTLEVFEWHKK